MSPGSRVYRTNSIPINPKTRVLTKSTVWITLSFSLCGGHSADDMVTCPLVSRMGLAGLCSTPRVIPGCPVQCQGTQNWTQSQEEEAIVPSDSPRYLEIKTAPGCPDVCWSHPVQRSFLAWNPRFWNIPICKTVVSELEDAQGRKRGDEVGYLEPWTSYHEVFCSTAPPPWKLYSVMTL